MIPPFTDRRIYSAELEQRTIAVGGAERSYWTAPQPAPTAPLLVVLHGTGLDGPRMAGWTGLAVRGPAAGFATVFPDAVNRVWDDTGQGRADGLDDAAFVSGLIELMVSTGLGGRGAVFLVGLSNGAFFAERLARQGKVEVQGLVLVSGTAREVAPNTAQRPERPTAVLCSEGTADPMVPYAGGRPHGPLAWLAHRRARRFLTGGDRRAVVGPEVLAADWAIANGCGAAPAVEHLPGQPGDVAVDRLGWTAPGRPPVILYRITGGGHGWPGGPQYLPAAFVGRVAQSVDATGILLAFARDRLDREPA